MTKQKLWWQTGVIYQIYPRSFADANGDGIGDLPGILSHLDYIRDLGITTVWLSPIYPSPMHDFGYDVADYCDINPMFGTMKDFDILLAETHQRGIKLILDLVPNHTSSDHPWFLESRSSRDNPKRDWYIWREPSPAGGLPNNWLSHFGGPAWTFDEITGQYYLHQFVKQQPDLNYRNPEVEKAMLDVMRFWLEKGVDGFRVDVIGLMMKDPGFRDEPLNPNWDGKGEFGRLNHIYTANLPEVHELIHKMRNVLDAYPDRMMVGETYLPNDMLMKYYGTPEKPEAHHAFNFQLIVSPWDAAGVHKIVDDYEAALPAGAWPNWVLGNHDQHRLATRLGEKQARVGNMLLLTLRGTPTCYYGDEIGMVDGHIPTEFIQDPPALNMPEFAHIFGRDPERTPMQWSDAEWAGFSAPGSKHPWLPVADNYKTLNVAAQSKDPHSLLAFFRTLLSLRNINPALSIGSYRSLTLGNPVANASAFAYIRQYEDQQLLVALNFTDNEVPLDLPLQGIAQGLLSTGMDREGDLDLSTLTLGPNEGLLLAL